MTGKSPKPPPGTGVNGGKLWRDVLDAYELEEHELALLREAVRTVDQLDDLHSIASREGLVVSGPHGWKPHPAVVEARQLRIVLARVLAALRLPAGDEDDQVVRRPQRGSWNDYSDDYEEESLEEVLAILRKPPAAVTAPLLSVADVADSLVEKLPKLARDAMKLHQLCYLVQAHHLGRTAVPAFRERIIASSRGPLIEALAKSMHGVWSKGGDARMVEKEESISVVVDRVIRDYGPWPSHQLQELIQNQFPWIQAREGLGPYTDPGHVISPALMREYFAFQESLPRDGDVFGLR